MPTQRATELFFQSRRMKEEDWVAMIEGWLSLIRKDLKNRHFPLLESVQVKDYFNLGSLWEGSYGNVPMEPEHRIEGIWGSPRLRMLPYFPELPGQNEAECAFWGRSRDGRWLIVEISFWAVREGTKTFCKFGEIEVTETSLESVLEQYDPGDILCHIRDQNWTFQEKANQTKERLDRQAELMDEDYALLSLNGIHLPQNPHWTD